MEVLFADEKTRGRFSRFGALRKQYGEVGARKISLRLQQLDACPTLAHMRSLPGRCHALSADRAGNFAVDVHQPYRLVFRPHPPLTGAEKGDAWRQVQAVTIIDVADYH